MECEVWVVDIGGRLVCDTLVFRFGFGAYGA